MPSDASSFRPTLKSLPLDSLPAAILVLEEAEAMVEWSRAAAEIFHLADSHRGKPWSLLIPRAVRPHMEQALKLARQIGVWEGELTLQDTNGGERRAELRILSRSGTDERGFLVGVTNLSSRVNQERTFRQTWQRRSAVRLAAAAAAELRGSSSSTHNGLIEQFESFSRATEGPTEAELADAAIGSVLIVGCGPLERECLRLLLEAWGFTAHAAADGFEALEQLTADRVGVRVVVVDADLPGWGASAALTALKRREPFLPIVLLGSPEGKRISEDVAVVVPKPYRFEDLRWAIAECRQAAV